MLRGILRNVQYYMLFFSLLLVLLAFQRLQWYDQGLIPHSNSFLDGTELLRTHGRSMRSSNSGEDPRGGRIYYGGDESKEIGLFKFRIGLFKFVLPTFSKDPSSWSKSNEQLLTVPPPPHGWRSGNKKYGIGRSRKHTDNLDGYATIERKEVIRKFRPSVAYIVRLIPSARSDGHDDKSLQESCGFTGQAKILSKSIENAHTVNSGYNYQLYAIDFSTNISSPCRDSLTKIGYKIIAPTEGEVKGGNKILKPVFEANQIVVHMRLDDSVIKPLDLLYDNLLARNSNKSAIDKPDTFDFFALHGGSDLTFKENQDQANADAAASPSKLSVNEDSFFIFRTSSGQAVKSYEELLQCARRNETNKRAAASIMKRNGKQSDNSRKNALCSIQTERGVALDRCRYDEGSRPLEQCLDINRSKDGVIPSLHVENDMNSDPSTKKSFV